MKKRPSKVIWSSIPGNICNLNCSYCYVGQKKGVKGKTLYPKGKTLYSTEYILKCFKPERFGGPIFFGGASAGETLLWDGIEEFTKGMLSYGHIVSYTTNMTYTPVIEKFCDYPANLRSRLELDASLHYLELKRSKKLDVFFDNLRTLKSAGISIAIFLCIVDKYLPYLREISELCKKEIELLPIAGMLREYGKNGAKTIYNYNPKIDKLVRETCDVRQWELQKRIYSHKRNEFCHAGEYSLNLSLENGNYTKCWGNSGINKNWQKLPLIFRIKNQLKVPIVSNILNRIFKLPRPLIGNLFQNPNKLIKFEPIGNCPFNDCICASYLCWGLIPELDVETHSKIFFTRSTVSDEVWEFMDSKVN